MADLQAVLAVANDTRDAVRRLDDKLDRMKREIDQISQLVQYLYANSQKR